MPPKGCAPRYVRLILIGAALFCLRATPAWSQDSVDPNPGNMTITGAMDFSNAYFFRGIPQDDTGVVMFPAADLGFGLHSGDRAMKSVGVNVGLWNALTTGDAGLDGPSGKLWYESDFYTTLALGFGARTSLGVTYTAYTSPNSSFGTVQEVSFKFAVDDTGAFGLTGIKPYALLAQELDGQADGSGEEGTYLELGAVPSAPLSKKMTLSVPLRLGLGLNDYYETATGGNDTFGFFSVAGLITVPLSSMPTKFGSWNVHGSVEYLKLGERNADVYGHSSTVIGSIGIGLSY